MKCLPRFILSALLHSCISFIVIHLNVLPKLTDLKDIFKSAVENAVICFELLFSQ